jgi:hypothetical protein
MLQDYSNASGEFLLELLYRVGDLYGTDLREKPSQTPNTSLKPTAIGEPVAAA